MVCLTVAFARFDSRCGCVSDRVDVVVPLKGLESAVAIDWDANGDFIYWSDVTTKTINRAKYDGSGDTRDENDACAYGKGWPWIP
jgi:hypothetical protein